MWRKVLNSRLWVSAGVVVILAAALIGGSIFVQKRGEQVRAQNAEVAVQQQKNNAKSDNNHTAVTDNGNSQAANGQTSQPSEPATDNSVSASGDLPQTGPGNIVGTAFVLALLTFTVVSYVSSRRLTAAL